MTIDIVLVTAVIGVITPFLNAFLTHANASPGFKAGITVVLVALGTIATWATNIVGTVTVRQLIVEAIIAVGTAGGVLASTLNDTKSLSLVQGSGLALGKPAAA